jgi:hypothetical protein
MEVKFQWETEEKEAMAILKKTLCNAPALKTLHIGNGAGEIAVGIDASLK